MKTVLNLKNVPVEERIMFLGPELSLQRFDQLKYPKFYDLYKKMETFRWNPERINLNKDRIDYEKMSDAELHTWESNIKFQTAIDACLSRSIHNISQYITNCELEAAISTWSSFEVLHSDSYSHVFKNVTKDATKFFDSILEDENIVKRSRNLIESYDAFFGNPSDIKQTIFDAVLNTQAVEGVTFYVSFICSFYFGAKEIMSGSADIIKEIARDEALHVSITQNIFKNWKNNPEEGFQEILKKNEDRIYDFYKLVVKQESDWAEYLFSKGSLLGLNEEILKMYIEYIANNRLGSLGYKKIFKTKNDPTIGWSASYFDSTMSQPAPQETEITSYLSNAANTDLNLSEFEGLL